jgi:hypothetical protein
MSTVTDPACELGEITARLTQASSSPGEKFLAEAFGVERWSTNFFKIITCIFERADLVGTVVGNSGTDKALKDNAQDELREFKSAFTSSALNQSWDQLGLKLMRDHGRTIQYLSPTVRQHVSYPRLTDQEVADLLKMIDDYLTVLQLNDEEPAFVRQSIIDGLTMFRFQLERIGWMGAAYALVSFREVLLAYEAANAHYTRTGNPDAEAFLSGLLAIIKTVKSKVDQAKSWTEAGHLLLKSYAYGSALINPLLLSGTLQLPHS